MSAIRRHVAGLSALASTPPSEVDAIDEHGVAKVIGMHLGKLADAFRVVTDRTWSLDADGVVCIWAGDQPTAWMNRRVFETLRGAPLTDEEVAAAMTAKQASEVAS